MDRYPLAAMNRLDSVSCDARRQALFDQVIGDAVVVAVHLDVLVNTHGCLLPFRELVPSFRQRLKHRPFQPLQHLLAATRQLLEGLRIHPAQQTKDGLVGLRYGEEGEVAQPGQDPPPGDQHPAFHLHLVLRPARACRDHSKPVVRGHLLVGPIDVRIVPARTLHRRFRVVGNDDHRHALDVLQGLDLGTNPVRRSVAVTSA